MFPLLARAAMTGLGALGLDHVVRRWVRGEKAPTVVVGGSAPPNYKALAVAAGAGALALIFWRRSSRKGRR